MRYKDNLMLSEGIAAPSDGAGLSRTTFPTIFAK
jgi:hypothetical protein